MLAERIKAMCARWKVEPEGVADDSCFNNHGHDAGSIADEFRAAGVDFDPAKKGDRITGWQVMRRLLKDAGAAEPTIRLNNCNKRSSQMQIYHGAVFFIDILGVGALTRKQIELSGADYDAWNCSSKTNVHAFSAKLLMAFRRVLNDIKQDEMVKVAQLSDCAFIWGASAMDVTNAARKCMWEMAGAGLLGRGGLAFGEIVEPDKVNKSLGQFVMGEAVTRAVDMERTGKGCRVFSDTEIAAELPTNIVFGKDEWPFAPIKNPLDCSSKDEFRWYLFPDEINQAKQRSRDSVNVATRLMGLVAHLRYDPRLGWNAATMEGAVHLAASIDTISASAKLYVKDEDYHWTADAMILGGMKNRSDKLADKHVERLRKEIAAELAPARRKKSA